MAVGCSASTGCTDVTACNYDIDAQLDDGGCVSAFELYGLNRDCDGNCIDGMTEDACGICGGTNTCCPPNVYDCNGDCGGSAIVDECGVCSGGNSGHTANSDKDCAGDCFGFAVVDECGVCVANPDETTALYCCDGQLICSPNTLNDCTNEYDECGVCGGDNSTCDASIMINNWKMWSIVVAGNQLQYGSGLSDTVTLNYPDDPEANIDNEHSMNLDIAIKPYGTGLDFEGSAAPDYNISLTLGIHIQREVGISGVQSNCHDIYGDVANPETVDLEYIAANANPQGVFMFEDISLPENIDLFKDVEINGTTYTLDRTKDFDAVYYITIYIKSFNIVDYLYDMNNVLVNDIDNPIFLEATLHHDPLPDACPGLLGDADGDGVLSCNDWDIATDWLAGGDCVDYLNNPSAPDRCCNVAMMHSPANQLTQTDLDRLLQEIVSGGGFCLEFD